MLQAQTQVCSTIRSLCRSPSLKSRMKLACSLIFKRIPLSLFFLRKRGDNIRPLTQITSTATMLISKKAIKNYTWPKGYHSQSTPHLYTIIISKCLPYYSKSNRFKNQQKCESSANCPSQLSTVYSNNFMTRHRKVSSKNRSPEWSPCSGDLQIILVHNYQQQSRSTKQIQYKQNPAGW